VNVDDLPPQGSNRWRSHAYRSAVALMLRDWGLHDVRPARSGESGDLVGLPGWVVTARNHRNVELSTSVDEVVRLASSVPGAPLSAAIIARRGREIAESYALLRLADFADVVALVHGVAGPSLAARVRLRAVEP
jgi:hypothetical protein